MAVVTVSDDVGGGGGGADDEALEAAAGDAGDAGGEAGGVAVDVLAVVGGDGEGAGGGPVGNGDVALIGMDRRHAVRGTGERGGEHVVDAGALIDGGGGEVDAWRW